MRLGADDPSTISCTESFKHRIPTSARALLGARPILSNEFMANAARCKHPTHDILTCAKSKFPKHLLRSRVQKAIVVCLQPFAAVRMPESPPEPPECTAAEDLLIGVTTDQFINPDREFQELERIRLMAVARRLSRELVVVSEKASVVGKGSEGGVIIGTRSNFGFGG